MLYYDILLYVTAKIKAFFIHEKVLYTKKLCVELEQVYDSQYHVNVNNHFELDPAPVISRLMPPSTSLFRFDAIHSVLIKFNVGVTVICII